MGLRHDHHLGVPHDHESGDVAGAELDWNRGPSGLSGADQEREWGAEHLVEPDVRSDHHGIHADPHRIEAVGILDLHGAREGVRRRARSNQRAVQCERELRGARPGPLLEARCREEESQRP